MFENLSERLQNVVSNIKSRGVINEDNISDVFAKITEIQSRKTAFQ